MKDVRALLLGLAALAFILWRLRAFWLPFTITALVMIVFVFFVGKALVKRH